MSMVNILYIRGDTRTHIITVIAADSTHNEAKMKLAEVYEILGEPRKALDLVMQGKVTSPSPPKLCPHYSPSTFSHINSH